MKIITTSLLLIAALAANMSLMAGSALALTNYSASLPLNTSGLPSALVVGKTYTFTANIHVNQQTPRPINSTGIWDVFGMSWDKINTSGGKTLNNPNDTSVTIAWLGANRGAGNDSQQAYTASGNVFPSGHTRWDDFQCGEIWLHQNQTTTGSTIKVTCSFTPKVTGFYQIDINSYFYYATFKQSCYTGWCGPIGGYFVKVVSPQPTATPTPRPTVTPTSTPSVSPTPTPTLTITPTPTVTPVVPTATPTPVSTNTNTNTNDNHTDVNVNVNNTNNNTVNITNNPTQTATVEAETVQAPAQTKQLPSTGTPIEAYSIISLLPLGWKFRKFAKFA